MINKANFGNVANDYAKFRDEIPSIIFDQLKDRNVEFFEKSVIDLGSGSGIFSRAMTYQGANVIGVETENRLITQAVERDKSLGLKIEYIQSTAEELTLSNNKFDCDSFNICTTTFTRSAGNHKSDQRIY